VSAVQLAPAGSEADRRLQAWVAELRAKTPSQPALGDELIQMAREDQRFRSEVQAALVSGAMSPGAREAHERQELLDRKNQARLAEIVEAHGWPGAALAGLGGADAAFLIVQHAPHDYQKKYLPMLEAAVARRDALPHWAAMLKDRVLMGDGKPQIYGTQVRLVPGATTLQLHPIEDEARVDERRAKVGLGPLADYLKEFGIVRRPGLQARQPGGPEGPPYVHGPEASRPGVRVPFERDLAAPNSSRGTLRRVDDLDLGEPEADSLDEIGILRLGRDRRHADVFHLDAEVLERGRPRLAHDELRRRADLVIAQEGHERRRRLVDVLHDDDFGHRGAGGGLPGDGGGRLHAPGPGDHLDLAFVVGVTGLARDALNLEEHVGDSHGWPWDLRP
jgi:hypothetical protein